MKKACVLFVFMAVIVGLYLFTPVRHFLSREGFAVIEAWIQARGVFAPLVFGAIYIVATIFALPGAALTIGGGLLFGAMWGTVINLISATVGALISFLIARYLGRGVMQRLLRASPTLEGLDARVEQHGFNAVFLMRIVPLFPFNALNYGCGLTNVTFKDYALATVFGMAPGCFVYTSIGAVGRHLDFSDPASWTHPQVWGPFVLMIVLVMAAKWITKNR